MISLANAINVSVPLSHAQRWFHKMVGTSATDGTANVFVAFPTLEVQPQMHHARLGTKFFKR